jgi:TetR/AcrR family transcriptional regulator
MPDKTAVHEKDGDTERRILDAARIVFVRRGTAGARMQEIAGEAGVNQALLHYYFRSKERLAATVFREAASRLLPAVVGVFGSDAPLEEKIEQFVHLYIDTVRRSPFLPGYVLSEMHHHPERLTAMLDSAGVQPAALVGALRRKLGEQLREREEQGAMRPISPEHFVVNMLGLVVIPFIARPALRIIFGLDDAAFEHFLDERRAELPRLILNSLRP